MQINIQKVPVWLRISAATFFGMLVFFLSPQSAFSGWNDGCPVHADGNFGLTLIPHINTHCVTPSARAGSGSRTYYYDPYFPTCTMGLSVPDPNAWYNTSITATVTSCSDVYANKNYSGCNAGSYTSIVLNNHNTNASGTAADNVGHTSNCSSTPNTKIDRAPVTVDSVTMRTGSVGGVETTLSSTPSQFEADENFWITLNNMQEGSNINPDPAGYISGISGIDYNNSTISISGPAALSSSLSGLAGGIGFDQATNIISFDLNTNIFQKSGTYTINFALKDIAGNVTNVGPLMAEIIHSEADEILTKIIPEIRCSNGSLLANATDSCQIIVRLKDRFGNPVTNRNVELFWTDQNINIPDYDYITRRASTDSVFLSGLRFTNGVVSGAKHKVTANTGSTGEQALGLFSYTPSIQIVEGSMPDAFLSRPNTQISKLTAIVDGTLHNGSASGTTTLLYNVDLRFDPWVKTTVSDKAYPLAGPGANLQFLIGNVYPVHVHAATNQAGKVLPSIPNPYTIYLKGNSASGSVFENADLGISGGFPLDTPGGSETKDISTLTTLRSALGAFGEFTIFFSTIIEHNAGGKVIIYPGGNLGNTATDTNGVSAPAFPTMNCSTPPQPTDDFGCNTTKVEAIMIGADIEGGILTEGMNFSYQATSSVQGNAQLQNVGSVSAIDVREDITRRAYDLIRSVTADTSTGKRFFNANNFVDGTVTYYKGGTIILGNGGTENNPIQVNDGAHTIVVEDGNVLIAGDMAYATQNDSLGIILMNSSATTKPTTGNLFVNNNVKKFVGTYFADGTITSTTHTSTAAQPDIADTLDRNDETILGKQLVLDGVLFTRNTLGGSMVKLAELFNPWGAEASIPGAQKYDLHFVRRYYPKTDNAGAQTNASSCVQQGAFCDPNQHSFVIRMDGRVQSSPPPGFDTVGQYQFRQ